MRTASLRWVLYPPMPKERVSEMQLTHEIEMRHELDTSAHCGWMFSMGDIDLEPKPVTCLFCIAKARRF